MAFSDEQYRLKFENPFGVLAGNALGLIAGQRIDPRQAARHIADIVRVIRPVQHVVGVAPAPATFTHNSSAACS